MPYPLSNLQHLLQNKQMTNERVPIHNTPQTQKLFSQIILGAKIN